MGLAQKRRIYIFDVFRSEGISKNSFSMKLAVTHQLQTNF
jgi:hypothetical protein